MNELAVIKAMLHEIITPVVQAAVKEELQNLHVQAPSHSSDRPLSIDQATSFTGLAKQTLYQKASRGEVPCSRLGKRLIFLESELIQWIKDARKGGRK